MKLDLFILTTPVYSAELLTDFSYMNFTVSHSDALDRLRVHLNIILLLEDVVIQLTKSKCVPCLMYGLDACYLNKSQLNPLDFTINRRTVYEIV